MATLKVAVRVRPFDKREISMETRCVVSMNSNQVVLDSPSPTAGTTPALGSSTSSMRPHKFSFDYAYWSHDVNDSKFVCQSDVYRDLGTDVVESAFAGYNACVFAYGQTGSGKTYTMMGSDEAENRGLIPRICETLFSRMARPQSKSEDNASENNNNEGEGSTTYRTEVSYMEIYNERVRDLLRNSKSDASGLRVREHPVTGPYVQDLSKHLVVDYPEMLALMRKGTEVRTTASTNMNDTSSRSHSIFTITFVHAGFEHGLPYETVSKIHLVDLAGSERADATGTTGIRLKEGGHINKSLVTLGSVISSLAEASSRSAAVASKPVFIPYRDSVLTWLLKDSLGGNSKTIMIAAISPAEINHGETLSTLRYANRAKNIVNKPTVNEDPNVRLIRELRDEIERLRSMMQLDTAPSMAAVRKQLEAKEAQERHLTEEWTEKWREAANILKEQRALALKRTGLGVMLDSDKPHLVGIDGGVLATGITLYHLKEGDTSVGSEAADIALQGSGIMDSHCVIRLRDGVTTLLPTAGATCTVNAMAVTEPVRLTQGSVVVLGKTNMFRFNDPSEVASLKMNASSHELFSHSNLLSQSLSDLRNGAVGATTPSRRKPKLHSSEGNIQKSKEEVEIEPESKMEDDPTLTTSASSIAGMDESISSLMADGDSSSSASNSGDTSTLYRRISEQKEMLVACLESEQCDLPTLTAQMELLCRLQEQYGRATMEDARRAWAASSPRTAAMFTEDKDLEDRFEALVEQEVERRLFQERYLRGDIEIDANDLLLMEKERELNEIRRQHEREVYALKRKLYEAQILAQRRSLALADQSAVGALAVLVNIPKFRTLSEASGNSHVEYELVISAGGISWTVWRRFREFRQLHVQLGQAYGEVVRALSFPPRRFFGSMSGSVCSERQHHLQAYVNQALQCCARMPSSPLYAAAVAGEKTPQDALIEFSPFFQPNTTRK